jgi:hypothetical protein
LAHGGQARTSALHGDPRDHGTRFRRPARLSSRPELCLCQLVERAHAGHDLVQRWRYNRGSLGAGQHLLDERVAPEYARLIRATVEFLAIAFLQSLQNELAIAAACTGWPRGQEAQDPVRAQPGYRRVSKIGAMPAPGLGRGIGDQPGPYRIEMNVAHQG